MQDTRTRPDKVIHNHYQSLYSPISAVKRKRSKKNIKYRKLSEQAKTQQSRPPVTDAHGQT